MRCVWGNMKKVGKVKTVVFGVKHQVVAMRCFLVVLNLCKKMNVFWVDVFWIDVFWIDVFWIVWMDRGSLFQNGNNCFLHTSQQFQEKCMMALCPFLVVQRGFQTKEEEFAHVLFESFLLCFLNNKTKGNQAPFCFVVCSWLIFLWAKGKPVSLSISFCLRPCQQGDTKEDIEVLDSFDNSRKVLCFGCDLLSQMPKSSSQKSRVPKVVLRSTCLEWVAGDCCPDLIERWESMASHWERLLCHKCQVHHNQTVGLLFVVVFFMITFWGMVDEVTNSQGTTKRTWWIVTINEDGIKSSNQVSVVFETRDASRKLLLWNISSFLPNTQNDINKQ